MMNDGADRSSDLHDLVKMEVADIVATASEQGFSAKETLAALSLAVRAGAALAVQDPDIADDHRADA